MQRDTWPPTPPSQTTLSRLYQMGVTFPPAPLCRPCHGQLQGQRSRESGGGLVTPQDTWARRGEMSHRRAEHDCDPPRCLSPSPVSSLFRTPSSVNDVNVFRCWREENRSVFSCLGLSEVAGVAFSPSPRLWKSRSHPRRQIFFRSISHPRFALIFRSEPRGSTCTVAGGGEGRAPTGSRGGGVHLWTGKKKKYSRSNFSSEL